MPVLIPDAVFYATSINVGIGNQTHDGHIGFSVTIPADFLGLTMTADDFLDRVQTFAEDLRTELIGTDWPTGTTTITRSYTTTEPTEVAP